MIQLQFKNKEVNELLAEIKKKVDDLSPVLKTVGETVRTSIVRNFEKTGRPAKWKKSHRAKEEGGQTLSDKGRLKNSFTVDVNRDSVRVGTNVVYAAVHHFGAKKGSFGTVAANIKAHVRRSVKTGKESTVKAHTRKMKLPWGDIPARPFALVQNEDRTEILAMLGEHILG